MNRLLQVGGEEKVPGRNEPAVAWAGSLVVLQHECFERSLFAPNPFPRASEALFPFERLEASPKGGAVLGVAAVAVEKEQ